MADILSTQAPKKTNGDMAHAVLKGALSIVPVAGGPLVELFTYLVDEPVSKRRDEWIADIAGRVREAERRLNEPLAERLKNDEAFTTVLLNATHIAIRNHQREKIDALANAVINTAVGIHIDETERAIMLQLIDRLTPAHLSILRLFQEPCRDPRVAVDMHGVMTGALPHVVNSAFPEMSHRDSLLRLIWRDLCDAGLLAGDLYGTKSASDLVAKRSTAFGDRFIEFISEPRV